MSPKAVKTRKVDHVIEVKADLLNMSVFATNIMSESTNLRKRVVSFVVWLVAVFAFLRCLQALSAFVLVKVCAY